MIDNRTPNLDLPLPNVNNLMKSEDVPRLRDAITLLDQAVADRVSQADLDAAISALLGNAPPAALDTLNELAAAINDDANFAATITTQLATKLSAVPTATSVVLGGVKVGSGLVIDGDGVLSTTGAGSGTGLPSFAELVMTPSSNGQTTFTPAGGYVAGQIELYLNGILLIGNGDDYTASNGTTIVLTVGANTVDKLLLRKWYYIPVEMAVNKTGDTMTGPLSVPAAASGTQAPQVQEVVKKAGDSMAGALNELKAPNIPAATTTNVWGLTGNSATLIGTTTIASLGTAPQAGAKRTLIAAAATPLTHSANLQLPGGANYTTAVGDRLEIYAETTTQHRVSIWKADGTAVVSTGGGISTVSATVTANTTLAANAPGYQPVQMAGAGRSITLPDATTQSLGGPRFLIDNSQGQYPVGIRNSSGALVMAVGAGGTGFVSLKDKTTAAGVWAVTGDLLEPGLVTFETEISASAISTEAPRPVFVALDDNVSIHFGRNPNDGISAYVVDNTGKVVSNPVSITVISSSVPVQAFKISATQAILFYGSTAADHNAVVLTLTGSSPTYSLSVGSAANTNINYGSLWGGENFRAEPKIVQLSPTLYVAGLNKSGNAIARAISVSGTTITIGAETATIAVNAQNITMYALTATTALVIIKAGASAAYGISAAVLSVSGTTVTPSTLNPTGLNSSVLTAPSSVKLSETKVIVMDNDNAAPSASAIALTISGTSVTAGSLASNFNANAGDVSYAGGNAGRYNPKLWRLNDTQAGFWMVGNSTSSQHGILSAPAANVTASAQETGITRTSGTNNAGYGHMLPQGVTEFLSIRQQLSDSAGFGLQVTPAKIDVANNKITAGAGDSAHDAFQQAPTSYLAGRTSAGDYLLLAKGVNAVVGPAKLLVMRSNGEKVADRGKISIPEITVNDALATPYPIAIVSSNRVVLVGDTVSSFNNLRRVKVVNVEIAV